MQSTRLIFLTAITLVLVTQFQRFCGITKVFQFQLVRSNQISYFLPIFVKNTMAIVKLFAKDDKFGYVATLIVTHLRKSDEI